MIWPSCPARKSPTVLYLTTTNKHCRHQLRKSATFTALDFAPPGRLRTNDNGSETGSIRSNRSGLSAIHQHNIRKGAYRVSRIPKEVAGTRDDLSAALRPQWDMNR
jgi:hypothetical protein